ncbi:MAG TPA: cupin domain-containing protein [Casimicrobiaceae bacterium]|nr:cupin domain-containing protein [Casimicrobiaceae bacterium]
MNTLGTLEELPLDYRKTLEDEHLAPLWPMLRDVLPHDAPRALTRPCLWAYQRIRPLLLRAGELTPVEKAERRVLVLCDPGRGAGAMQATSVIYCGLQLLLPGEVAPAHRHTPSAARIVVEGEGAYTVVEGEKCPMLPGDLILTPGGTWHDHGHEGATPVVWLDALDLPLFVYLEGSYAKERALQTPDDRPDASQVEYTAAGLLPARPPESAAPRYPLLRYPWQRTRRALQQAGASLPNGQPVELDYVNPETGGSCLPTLGFTAVMLPPDKRLRTPKRSSSAVFHVVEGEGQSTVNGEHFAWHAADTFSAPAFADIEHEASAEPAFLVRIHDAPLQQKLGFYEERTS